MNIELSWEQTERIIVRELKHDIALLTDCTSDDDELIKALRMVLDYYSPIAESDWKSWDMYSND